MSKRKQRHRQAADAARRREQPSQAELVPKAKQQKMPPGFTADAFQNVLARLGAGTPNLLEGTNYPMTRLSQDYQLMNSLYRSHWIIRRVIDTIPEDMTRNWITLTSQLDPEQLRRVNKLWRTRRVKSKILHGLKWGRLYGGAVGLILIEGHEDILHEPLDYDTIMPGSFKGLMILDRWSGVSPNLNLVSNIDDVEFGLPSSYRMTMDDGQMINVHHSRIIRFAGRELPHWERIAEQHWGASEVEVVFDELKKRDNTSWNIAQLIFLANLRVLKMSDMGEVLATGNEKAQSDLYNTLQAQNWLMSNMGMYLLGKDDDFATHQYSFGGLNDIYESFMLDMAGASQIPVTKLFGRAPAGMNATGESDMQNYYEVVQQQQESTLGPVLDKILPVMFMSELGGIPDDYDYVFDPIRTPDDKDVAELADKKTTSIINAYSAGLISRRTGVKELKQLGESTGMFTSITDADIEEADEDLDTGDIMPGDEEVSSYGGFMGASTPNREGVPQGYSGRDGPTRKIADWFRRSLRNRKGDT